jgi:hypothetical protein
VTPPPASATVERLAMASTHIEVESCLIGSRYIHDGLVINNRLEECCVAKINAVSDAISKQEARPMLGDSEFSELY